MDFQEYVAARRPSLVRAAALLGADEATALLVAETALRHEAARIQRRVDPDPAVCARLVQLAPPEPSDPPDGAGPGLAVRRAIATLDPARRAVAVLAFHAGLTPHETGSALGLTAAEVQGLEADVLMTLGVTDAADAQVLVGQAADTVGLPPMRPLARPARRVRWPVAVGLAALAALLAAGLLVDGGTRAPDEGPLADDQVPSLFGYDTTAATALLRGRGLDVVEQRVRSCEPVGLVVGSDPPTGTRFDAGDTVTLRTAAPSGRFCTTDFPARAHAWAFLAFATGRGPAPRFAARVAVLVDGRGPVLLAREEAADRSRWGDPGVLTELGDAMAVVYDVPGSSAYRTPTLEVTTSRRPVRHCGAHRPAGSGDRTALSLSLFVRNVGPYFCPLTLDLYRTAGAIDTVALYTARDPAG